MQHGYTSEETGVSEVEKTAHENNKAKAEKLTSWTARVTRNASTLRYNLS